jgi:hypothetical protein
MYGRRDVKKSKRLKGIQYKGWKDVGEHIPPDLTTQRRQGENISIKYLCFPLIKVTMLSNSDKQHLPAV